MTTTTTMNNTTDSTNTPAKVVDVSPKELKGWLDRGEAVLVDVREPVEHASEHITPSTLIPQGRIEPSNLPKVKDEQKLVLHCRSGNRSGQAGRKLLDAGYETVYHLAGGIEGWKSAGLPVERSATAPPIDVMRQVQIVAGSLVLLGVLLGAFVWPWFLVLSGFVGAGLTFAGATGFCGMAKLLALMPWNRAACASACA